MAFKKFDKETYLQYCYSHISNYQGKDKIITWNGFVTRQNKIDGTQGVICLGNIMDEVEFSKSEYTPETIVEKADRTAVDEDDFWEEHKLIYCSRKNVLMNGMDNMMFKKFCLTIDTQLKNFFFDYPNLVLFGEFDFKATDKMFHVFDVGRFYDKKGTKFVNFNKFYKTVEKYGLTILEPTVFDSSQHDLDNIEKLVHESQFPRDYLLEGYVFKFWTTDGVLKKSRKFINPDHSEFDIRNRNRHFTKINSFIKSEPNIFLKCCSKLFEQLESSNPPNQCSNETIIRFAYDQDIESLVSIFIVEAKEDEIIVENREYVGKLFKEWLSRSMALF